MSAMSETFGCGKEGANALIAKNPGVSAAGGGWYGADKLWSRPAGTEGFGNETRGTTLSTKHGFFCFGFCFHCAFCSLSFPFPFPPFPVPFAASFPSLLFIAQVDVWYETTGGHP